MVLPILQGKGSPGKFASEGRGHRCLCSSQAPVASSHNSDAQTASENEKKDEFDEMATQVDKSEVLAAKVNEARSC